LIEDIFWPVDAHKIMQIPLTPDREDFVAWHYNKLGLFSVQRTIVSGIISLEEIIEMRQ
jgi:hypothetical protein